MTIDPPFSANRYSLLVPWRDITEILFTWKVGSHIELPDFSTGTRRDNGAAVNIPRDCTVLHVDTDPMSRCFFIAICHPSFPTVPDSMKAPEITASRRSAHMVVRDDGTIRDVRQPDLDAFSFTLPTESVAIPAETVAMTTGKSVSGHSIMNPFGFTIPAGAAITGIRAEVDYDLPPSRGPGRVGETTTCESCHDVIPLQEAVTYTGLARTQILCKPCHNGELLQ